MADKLTYIPNNDQQNCPLCILQLDLETQLNEQTNQNSNKVPNLLTLGTSVPPPILKYHLFQIYFGFFVSERIFRISTTYPSEWRNVSIISYNIN